MAFSLGLSPIVQIQRKHEFAEVLKDFNLRFACGLHWCADYHKQVHVLSYAVMP